MSNMRVTPDDWRDAIVTCTVTPPAGFEVENTQNTIRSDVLRTPDTTTFDINATWAESRVGSALYLFNHLLHGASLRVRFYSDAAWTTPSVAYSDSGTVAALCYTTTADVYTNSLGTKDQHKADSPYWLYFTETTYRSAKITVSGTPSAVNYFQIGRVLLGRYSELARSPKFGLGSGQQDTGKSIRTEGGSKRGYPGSAWPTLVFELGAINFDERAFWRDFMLTHKRGIDFGISIYPGDGDTLERDNTINGTLTSVDALGHEFHGFTNRMQVEGC